MLRSILLIPTCAFLLCCREEPTTPDGSMFFPADMALAAQPFDGGIAYPRADGGVRLCYYVHCVDRPLSCGNCLDDDGDGLIDDEDPECLGPCDHSERYLHEQIPGVNRAPCRADCYFDLDIGTANDGCFWDNRCDPHEVPPNYYPEAVCAYTPSYVIAAGVTCSSASTMQSALCANYCGPLTPNGCDCFGCCAIGAQGAIPGQGIYLRSEDSNGGPSCSFSALDDPARCHPCQIVSACFKPCGRCQLCIGKRTLPDDCLMSGVDGGASSDSCPSSLCPGGTACGLAGCAPCPPTWGCVSGCCVPPRP